MNNPRRFFGVTGFTRVEALAVMAAVGCLGMMAAPRVAGTASDARTFQCLDNFRRLALALAVYTSDQGYYPPNFDDAGSGNWVAGSAGPRGTDEFNTAILRDPARSRMAPYFEDFGVEILACPSDLRRPMPNSRLDPGATPARSVALNNAVGVNPRQPGVVPTPGSWLDNNHAHVFGSRWLTYGSPEDVVAPSPDRLATFIEEDEQSINDGLLAFGMERAEWIDWPATRHAVGGNLSFADGHVEARRWMDPRTVVGTSVQRLNVPGSVDYEWLRERISAPIPR